MAQRFPSSTSDETSANLFLVSPTTATSVMAIDHRAHSAQIILIKYRCNCRQYLVATCDSMGLAAGVEVIGVETFWLVCLSPACQPWVSCVVLTAVMCADAKVV
jgi:hypothetical protein